MDSHLLQVASKWHTDVAMFLIDNGADPNRMDFLGRTPLHVAAADDYPDMVKLLIDSGGRVENLHYTVNVIKSRTLVAC